MENLIDILAKILAALIFIGVAWLCGKIKNYMTVKAKATGNDDLVQLVQQFCNAAEQQYKAGMLTADQRKEYVFELLQEANVEVTDIVDALIEAAVYRINKGEV